ncbi:F13A-like protein, partial [Mya arenaria]
FEEGILDVCFSLVRRGFGQKNIRAMAQPIKVARKIAKMVGGKEPWTWVGSVKILREYQKTGVPVKFGQCWVFSCVTTTGVYTCGPAPLPAIKDGLCDTNFDSGFVFAEVNADEVHWKLLPHGQTKRLKILKRRYMLSHVSSWAPENNLRPRQYMLPEPLYVWQPA